jgi:acyl carrier protein
MNDTFARIRNLLAGEFEIDPATIVPATPLTALGVDSLAALEFVFILEDMFHVTLDAQTDLRGGLVQDLIDAVEHALAGQSAPAAAAAGD